MTIEGIITLLIKITLGALIPIGIKTYFTRKKEANIFKQKVLKTIQQQEDYFKEQNDFKKRLCTLIEEQEKYNQKSSEVDKLLLQKTIRNIITNAKNRGYRTEHERGDVYQLNALYHKHGGNGEMKELLKDFENLKEIIT